MMRAAWIQAVVVGVALCGAGAATAQAAETDALQLTAGTMQLGGSATFTTTVNGGFLGTRTGFNFSLAPSAGYFVVDRFELLASVSLSVPFGDLGKSQGKNVGALLGARYHLELGPRLALYAGAEAGVGYLWYDGNPLGNIDYSYFAVSVPVGLLVGLNAHVALDVGIRFSVNHAFDFDITTFSFPIGFLGVQAFF